MTIHNSEDKRGLAVEGEICQLIRAIYEVHEVDHGCSCETCLDQLHAIADMACAGCNLGEVMPVLEKHLANCAECREEFEAIVAIIRAEADGALSDTESLSPRA
jgi:hypothetical protein